MPPTSAFMVQNENFEEPISRTYQYRKVMKPMLERKRRARINRCLDELKELMVTALQAEGENVSKLEKADILELTVKHLHSLKRQHQLAQPDQSYADRFRAGFTHCATEVSNFLCTPKDSIDPTASAKLLQHLNTCIRRLEAGVITPQPIAHHHSQALNLVNNHHMNLVNPALRLSPQHNPINTKMAFNPATHVKTEVSNQQGLFIKQEPINLVQTNAHFRSQSMPSQHNNRMMHSSNHVIVSSPNHINASATPQSSSHLVINSPNQINSVVISRFPPQARTFDSHTSLARDSRHFMSHSPSSSPTSCSSATSEKSSSQDNMWRPW